MSQWIRELRTSDTILLTPFGTNIGITPQDATSTTWETALPEDRLLKSHPHLVTTIDSLLSFVHYIIMLPKGIVDILQTDQDTMSQIANGPGKIKIIGQGLSFTVREERDYPISQAFRSLFGRYWTEKDSKSNVVAVKVPRIASTEHLGFDAKLEARCLKSIAWECHVLSLPAVRTCENIIKMIGITWRPAFAATNGSTLR